MIAVVQGQLPGTTDTGGWVVPACRLTNRTSAPALCPGYWLGGSGSDRTSMPYIPDASDVTTSTLTQQKKAVHTPAIEL
jgi:hypothetical protein